MLEKCINKFTYTPSLLVLTSCMWVFVCAAGMISNSVACAVVDTRIVRENGRPQYAEYQVSVAAPSRYELGTPIKRWKTWKR
mmetsp:Transcript_35647/g.44195  ORF Transcript_35647/g.44195 Transcript_35647/m.44195 type:complete len:82 (+) Transcript_35647:719-964(+)